MEHLFQILNAYFLIRQILECGHSTKTLFVLRVLARSTFQCVFMEECLIKAWLIEEGTVACFWRLFVSDFQGETSFQNVFPLSSHRKSELKKIQRRHWGINDLQNNNCYKEDSFVSAIFIIKKPLTNHAHASCCEVLTWKVIYRLIFFIYLRVLDLDYALTWNLLTGNCYIKIVFVIVKEMPT